MTLSKEKKKSVISDFKRSRNDSGSVEVQVSLLTEQINGLEPHFKVHKKDQHSRYGLIRMVSKRKTLLSYLHRIDPERYQNLITRLKLRK